MGFHRGPKIVTDGLVLYLDAANPKSYPGTGTIWNDLSGNGNNAIKNNGSYNNTTKYWESVYDPDYLGGTDKLAFTVGHSTSINNAFSTTTGGWTIEEWIRIDDNTYPEAAAGGVGSNNAYKSGQIGFDWNHGEYNNYIEMGVGNNVGQGRGYDVNQSLSLPSKFQTLGQWLCRTLYWDRANDTMGAYYNGEFINDIDISSVSGQTLYDGGGITFGTLYGWTHDGARAGIKTYNRVLSASEVQQNYNAIKSRFGL